MRMMILRLAQKLLLVWFFCHVSFAQDDAFTFQILSTTSTTVGQVATTLQFLAPPSIHSSTITSWVWILEEGVVTSTDVDPIHTFRQAGFFPVTLQLLQTTSTSSSSSNTKNIITQVIPVPGFGRLEFLESTPTSFVAHQAYFPVQVALYNEYNQPVSSSSLRNVVFNLTMIHNNNNNNEPPQEYE